eukprot:TRINITY_DN17784_c0_g1_i1.p3 TRINITY_DN17784_c0_g1~~TRINITY_DN17784_c0_g1_i1.p3  ORF type:complete len:109 (-),score=21.92 TRINITY_DN17784_c0_g1_i1:60-386(-)
MQLIWGEVILNDREGGGAVVHLVMPLDGAGQEGGDVSAAMGRKAIGAQSTRQQMANDILIVDDEADIRSLIEDILKDEGHETRSAGSRTAALKSKKKINTKRRTEKEK